MNEGDPDREQEPAVALEFIRNNSAVVIAFAVLVITAATIVYAIYAQRQWEAIEEQQGERVRLTRAELFAKSPALDPGGSVSLQLANIGQLTALAPTVDIYTRRLAGGKVIGQNHESRQLNDVPSHDGEKSPLGTIALPNFSPAEAGAIGSGSESVVIEIGAQYRDDVGDRPEYIACWKSEAKGAWNPCSPDLTDDMQSIESPQEQQ